MRHVPTTPLITASNSVLTNSKILQEAANLSIDYNRRLTTANKTHNRNFADFVKKTHQLNNKANAYAVVINYQEEK